jgi:DNA-binding IclR family transcriptional regulator
MQTFMQWLESRTRQSPIPETTRLTRLLAAAGEGGVKLRDLRRVIKLDRDLLHQLLAAMVATGQVTVGEADGETVYYSLS